MRLANTDDIMAACRALPAGSPILVLGAPDTGKTHFTRQTARFLGLHCGLSVAVVDADVDQTEVGSPGTVAMLISGPGDWPDALRSTKPTDSAFVGAISASSAPLAWVTGTARMTREAVRLGAARIVIDTPSATATGLTREMVLALLDTSHPAMVVAICRKSELDPMLAIFNHLAAPPVLVRMMCDPETQRKSRSVRASRRAARFHAHFTQSIDHTLRMEDAALLGTNLRTGEPQPGHVRKFIGAALGGTCVHAEVLPDGGVHVVLDGPARRVEGAAVVEEHFGTRGVTITAADTYSALLCGLLDQHRKLLDVSLISKIDFAAGRITITTPLHHPAGIAQIAFGSVRLRPDGRLIGEVVAGTF